MSGVDLQAGFLPVAYLSVSLRMLTIQISNLKIASLDVMLASFCAHNLLKAIFYHLN